MQISARNILPFLWRCIEAAKAMGVDLLCRVQHGESSCSHVEDIPDNRAVLRAMHFYRRKQTCCRCCKSCWEQRWRGISHVFSRESGNSSLEGVAAELLFSQNCKGAEDHIRSLALTKLFLNKIDLSICQSPRLGFASVIVMRTADQRHRRYMDYMAEYIWTWECLSRNIRSTGSCTYRIIRIIR